MTTARVTLNGCLTFNAKGGRKWKRGQTETISKASELSYYRSCSEFSVSVVEKEKAAAAPAAPAGPKVYSEAELSKLRKADLQALATKRELDASGSIADLIEVILAAQEG
jgi:hypothetical protein